MNRLTRDPAKRSVLSSNVSSRHLLSPAASESSGYVLGVDGGATKTEAIVTDLLGQPMGAGRSGCGNWEVVGDDRAAETIFQAIDQSLERARIDLAEIRNVHIGLAGIDWPGDEPRVRRALEPYLGRTPITLENDAYLGARACTAGADGITISAGTGVCSSYLGPDGEKYCDAYFGEFGGGLQVDPLAVHAIIRAADGRGPETALTAAVLEATGYPTVRRLMHALTREQYTIPHSAIRPPLFQAAARGDAVAVAIVSSFGRELGGLATNLIRKYELRGTEPHVVASGSLFTRTGPLLFNVFSDVVRSADPSARIKLNDRPPVAGAVRAALHACGVHTNSSWETTSAAYQEALDN